MFETLQKGANGVYLERSEYIPSIMRALVVAVDTAGGKLETENGSPLSGSLSQTVTDQSGKLASYTLIPTIGPNNPPNSIRARVIGNERDSYRPDDLLKCYWPSAQGVEIPSPGEVVYVVFEDPKLTHGMWIGKVPVSNDDVNVNQELLWTTIQARKSNSGIANFSGDPVMTQPPSTAMASPSPVDIMFKDLWG